MDRALLSFTPVLSKRLIAKGVCALPEVKHAFKAGKIVISTGTTTSHIYAELCGKFPDSALACGIVTAKGMCVGRGMTDFLGAHGYAKFWFFDRGRLIETDDLDQILGDFSADDVFVKGANAVDSKGQAGILLAMENAGTVGKAIGHVMAKGISFVIPVGLEKVIQGSVADVSRHMGTRRLTHSSGMPVGMISVAGTVVTEIEALQELADVRVFHAASGGIAGGEGSVTLLVEGPKKEIKRVIGLYTELRDDDRHIKLATQSALCVKHKWQPCIKKNLFYKDNVKKEI